MPELRAVHVFVRVVAEIHDADVMKYQYGSGYFLPTRIEFHHTEGEFPNGEFSGPRRKADGTLSTAVFGHHHFWSADQVPEALRPILDELVAKVNNRG